MTGRRTILVLVVFFSPLAAMAGNRDQEWKQVEEAVKKDLPKSAIERLKPIIEAALREKAYPEALKAIKQRIELEARIEGNWTLGRITRIEAEIAHAPAPLVPAMELVVAHWYWEYWWNIQEHRRDRGRVADEDAQQEAATWDVTRVWTEAEKYFTRALAAAAEIKKVSFSEYEQVLDPYAGEKPCRATLYDYAAYATIDFYTRSYRGSAEPEDAFDLRADSPIFVPAEEFMKWEVQTADAESPLLKTIRLYQALLRFHKDDTDQEAFADADRLRLKFGYEKASGTERAERYKAALKQHVSRNRKHSAMACADWAALLLREGNPLEAHSVAKAGAAQPSQSLGWWKCQDRLRDIETRTANITVERVWNEPLPPIRVCYRNITQIYFRVVRDDWQTWRKNPQAEAIKARAELLRKKPDMAWAAPLPPTADFRERTEEVAAPKGLAPGFYHLIASYDPAFSTNKDGELAVSLAQFWVSDLALVMRVNVGDGLIQGLALDARSGEPLEGADVQTWLLDDFAHTLTAGPAGKTGRDGRFALPSAARGEGRWRYAFVGATYKGQQLITEGHYSNSQDDYRFDRPYDYDHAVVFTDRSLYRPGQTIHYKGIRIRVGQPTDRYEVLPNDAVTVWFMDANGKLIAEQRHRTNQYGSFSGTFIAPYDRLCGRMSIQAGNGSAVFHVEEYKRPKFQVVLDAPKTPARLGGQVCLQGRATAYTGAAIGGAKIRYRIVRLVKYPEWCEYQYYWRDDRAESQEIAHATATTGPDGMFAIRFTARPDTRVDEKSEPTFEFAITADVTDTAGETCRAERKLNVGYAALRASLATDEWLTGQKPVEIAVATQTLDGEPEPAQGVLKIYCLKQPAEVRRPNLLDYPQMPCDESYRRGRPTDGTDAGAHPGSWARGEVVAQTKLATDAAGHAAFSAQLPPGAYMAEMETRDRFGTPVRARLPLQVLAPEAKTLQIKVPYLVAVRQAALQPGDEFTALWATGYDQGRAYVEIEHRGKLLQSYWTVPGNTQAVIRQPVTEAMRGGFTLRVTMVRENRAYLTSRRIDVPWTNKNLNVTWEHLVSKLQPAQKETWTAVIRGPDAKKAVAEMVATLYDRSLDAYLPHVWQRGFGVFREDRSKMHVQFENGICDLGLRSSERSYHWSDSYDEDWPRAPEVAACFWGYECICRMLAFQGGREPPLSREAAAKEARRLTDLAQFANDIRISYGTSPAERPVRARLSPGAGQQPQTESPLSGRDLSYVAARSKLDETAFFFPHLISDADGTVKLEFTMPETLTDWKFLGFAHDRELRAGLLQGQAVTAKDLMVQPNPPRFLREGDVLEFTVKVSNQSAQRQAGNIRLTFSDARSGKSVDADLENTVSEKAFDVPARQSRSYSWRLTVRDGIEGVLTYKAVAATDRLSDGEEAFLPVLPRRVFVTESLPLPLRGPQTKRFDFARLRRAGESKTLRHQGVVVQMTSNPSWYAVMSLPYLMEYPWECSEQTFNRLYANALARHIIASDAKIRQVFDQWKGTPSLDSPLEKKNHLKTLLLEETPWIWEAQREGEARRNVGILFDDNHMQAAIASALQKLREAQREDGSWSWFPGGRADEYITLYIVTGFGRLRHLGVTGGDRHRDLDESMDYSASRRALSRLDEWIDGWYREILAKGHPESNNLSSIIAFYLYGRSFFLEDKPIDGKQKEAVDYFLGQARQFWAKSLPRQSQAHLALALKRFGDAATARDIVRSLKERSVSSEELGMCWRDEEGSPWWFHSPIETQAMMIEAFDEVASDAQAVEDCKVWLLKHKQVQGWRTTKGTADAVYALLLRGTKLLASKELVEVTLGGIPIKPEKVEAGTGFYEQRFLRGEVTPDLGRIVVKKADPGIAWGSVHWQYLEDVGKITRYEGTPLQVSKALYTRQYKKKGPVLEPVRGPIKVGDEVVVRLVVRTDREMEYVHLKDQRPSGLEPATVLSGYRYFDGLACYQSTRDTATHFFITRLPRGTHVFEYSARVVHQGEYQSGLASIQCMYAPEFNGHSKSLLLTVRAVP